MNYARDIKDLSIALEALSRIAGRDAENLSFRVQHQIDKAITRLEDQYTQSAPTKPITNDEIPF